MAATTSAATQQQAAATTNLPDLNTSTKSGSSSASTTNSPSASATDSSLPGLNDSTSTSSSAKTRTTTPISGGLTGAPTLTNNLPTLTGYFSYPPPTVPPRTNAPYLQNSSLPSDFVFIIVGAALGLVTIVILGWRLTVAWQANRSVKLHNTKGGANYHNLGFVDMKYGGGVTGHPDPVRAQSSHNLPDYPLRPSTGPGMQSNSSLFFSPTAAAASGVRNSQRASAYLASGYYGAGNATH